MPAGLMFVPPIATNHLEFVVPSRLANRPSLSDLLYRLGLGWHLEPLLFSFYRPTR